MRNFVILCIIMFHQWIQGSLNIKQIKSKSLWKTESNSGCKHFLSIRLMMTLFPHLRYQESVSWLHRDQKFSPHPPQDAWCGASQARVTLSTLTESQHSSGQEARNLHRSQDVRCFRGQGLWMPEANTAIQFSRRCPAEKSCPWNMGAVTSRHLCYSLPIWPKEMSSLSFLTYA